VDLGVDIGVYAELINLITTIVTILDGPTEMVRWFAPKEAEPAAENFASIFLENYVRAHGIPMEIVPDCDFRFQSAIWEAFTKAIGTKRKFSMAFHSQTDWAGRQTQCRRSSMRMPQQI
jgi:hypothetical protein